LREAQPGGTPPGLVWGYEAGDGEPGMGEGIGVGDPDAPVVVEIYEDFSCPHCADFEADARDIIKDEIKSGRARFVYYPVTLPNFGQPTVEAANAYACAVREGKGVQFHDALYADAGMPWDEDLLLDLGVTVGLESERFESCVRDLEFEDWVHSIDSDEADRQISKTPTIFVNSEEFGLDGDMSGAGLRIAIEQAAKKAGGDAGSENKESDSADSKESDDADNNGANDDASEKPGGKTGDKTGAPDTDKADTDKADTDKPDDASAGGDEPEENAAGKNAAGA